jgi:hypothetical protein
VTLLQVTLWIVLARLLLLLLLLLLMQMAEIRLGVQRWMEVWELLLHWRYRRQLVQMWQLQCQRLALWQLQLPGWMLRSKEMQCHVMMVDLNVEIGPLFSLG